jgi:hypothetical protein
MNEPTDGRRTFSQRIRGAIDRTIAEEQARQKTLADAASVGRSASTSSRKNGTEASKRNKSTKASAADAAADSVPNPDPAVFEAAFVIDDSDDPSRAGTPKPPPTTMEALNDDLGGEETKLEGKTTDTEKEKRDKADKDDEGNASANAKPAGAGSSVKAQNSSATASTGTELAPEIKQKLRKLEKLEATYPGMSNAADGLWLR